jgi:hypothetical protein
MQSDPLVEWQRLSELYRGMYDEELRALAADLSQLTEMARQVLHDEIRKRGLDAQRVPFPDANQQSNLPQDYTWKTLLCECNEQEEARQICAVLRQAGIECWIERPGDFSPHSQMQLGISPDSQWDMRNPRILVAADRLDEARVLAARPIPHQIVAQSGTAAPDFEPPVCPKCGVADPVLEGVDPCNAWRCDACGNQWTEPAEEAGPALEDNPEKNAP